MAVLRPVDGLERRHAGAGAVFDIGGAGRAHLGGLIAALLDQHGARRGIREPVDLKARRGAVIVHRACRLFRGKCLPDDLSFLQGFDGVDGEIGHLPVVPASFLAHPDLHVRDFLDLFQRHKEPQCLSGGNALVIAHVLFPAAVPPAVEVAGRLTHIDVARVSGVPLEILVVDAHENIVLGARGGDIVGGHLKKIALGLVLGSEPLIARVIRQADPGLSHVERVAGDIGNRLIIERGALIEILNRAGGPVDRGADFRLCRIVDRHGDEAGGVLFAQRDAGVAQPFRFGAWHSARRRNKVFLTYFLVTQRHNKAIPL